MTNDLISEFVDFEHDAQPLLDEFYRQRGYIVDRSKACKLFDVILTRGERSVKVEEKIRSHDYGDILLELVQDVDSGNPGWVSKTRCDYLVYAVVTGGQLLKVFVLTWMPFKNWLITEYFPGSSGKQATQYRWSARGYGVTLNAAIPITNIPPSYIQAFTATNL